MSASALSRILLVEDEPDIQMIARLTLESVGGFAVHTASSGREALKAAGTHAPDLILLDVMMPGMDGLAVFRALKTDPQTASIPVIFMTAKFQAHEVEAYKQLGALDTIRKPFDPMALPERIKAIWARHHG